MKINRYKLIKNRGEHRIVWESYMGEIPRGHQIHHINNNSLDNRIENLQACNRQDHSRYHSKNYSKVYGEWFKRCPHCKKLLPLENYSTFSAPKRKELKMKYWCKACIPFYNKKYWATYKKGD